MVLRVLLALVVVAGLPQAMVDLATSVVPIVLLLSRLALPDTTHSIGVGAQAFYMLSGHYPSSLCAWSISWYCSTEAELGLAHHTETF